MQEIKAKKEQISLTISKKTDRGITLIALMITVIVLLILATVTLNLTLRRKRNI